MKSFKAVLSLLAAGFLFTGFTARAATLGPAQITLDDFANAAYFTITNDGAGTQTYSLNWKTPPVKNIVRFAPRRVTVEPGGSLVIDLLYRKPEGLADGEYVSELIITPEENPERFEKTVTDFKNNPPTAKLDAPVSLNVTVKAGAQYRTDAQPETPAEASPATAPETPAQPEQPPAPVAE